VFAPVTHFHLSLIFVGKAGSITIRVEALESMACKYLVFANALAYYDVPSITAANKFKVQALWANVIILFMDVIFKKARVFVLGKHYQPSLMFVGKSRHLP
jgi:hypothetical protein